MQRLGDLETLSPEWDVPTKSLLSGTRKLCRRGCRKNVRARGDGGTKETRPSKHGRTDTHMSSQRRWQCAQDQHKYKTDKICPFRRGSGHKGPPLAEMQSVTDASWGEKSSAHQWTILSSVVGRHTVNPMVLY